MLPLLRMTRCDNVVCEQTIQIIKVKWIMNGNVNWKLCVARALIIGCLLASFLTLSLIGVYFHHYYLLWSLAKFHRGIQRERMRWLLCVHISFVFFMRSDHSMCLCYFVQISIKKNKTKTQREKINQFSAVIEMALYLLDNFIIQIIICL